LFSYPGETADDLVIDTEARGEVVCTVSVQSYSILYIFMENIRRFVA